MSDNKALEVCNNKVSYSIFNYDEKGEAPLEPNHTKFILIDDKKDHEWGGEIEFRGKLEKEISGGFFRSKSPVTAANQSSTSEEHRSPTEECSGSKKILIWHIIK